MKNYLSGLSGGEVAFLRDFFLELQRAVPDFGSYQPFVSGGHFDEDECRDQLRDEADSDEVAILEAVLSFPKRMRWPRLRQRAKFFLAARLSAAAGYCSDWLRANRFPANTPSTDPPADPSQYVRALLSDHWDDTACSAWVAANASSYIDRPFDYYSEEEQRRMDGHH